MARAQGVFQVTAWDEKTYQRLEGESKLTHARISQDFHGDLEATGTWDVLMFYRPDGTASYLGQVRLVGSLGGRSGSAVLRTEGGFDGNEARSGWEVIPGSGTGSLEGLEGRGETVAGHGSTGTYTLDHNLVAPAASTTAAVTSDDPDGDACAVRVPESESAL
jgi:Protein of unknown function (DUF3224)